MILNMFEETSIRNEQLPLEWQSQNSLDDLSKYLQLNWELRNSIYKDKESTTQQSFLKFVGQKGIRTNNYIGTIVFKGHQLNIFPKMFREAENDNSTENLDTNHLMKNLIQWLDYCTSSNYPYVNITSDLVEENNLKDLFVTLYVKYVKSTIDRSLFYMYESKIDDRNNIRGTINFQNYICKKLPTGQAHKFECNYTEFVVDNQINRIIKYVCKLLMKQAKISNKRIIRDILIKLNDVADFSYTPNDCDGVRLNNSQVHYKIIMSLSKMFLLNKVSSYTVDRSEAFCFLFPTELLFEGFIGGYIQALFKDKAKVRLQASEMTLVDDIVYAGESYGKAFTLRHDILVEHEDVGLFILDTKYKMTDRFEGNHELKRSITSKVSQSDLYQIREYAAKRGISNAYLVYPMFRFEEEEVHMPKLEGEIEIENEKFTITVHLVRVPFVFEENIDATKEMLSRTIERIFV